MSKIKIAGLIALFMIVVVFAAINVNVALQERGFSDLSLANMEALAKIEFYTIGGGPNPMIICCDLDNKTKACKLECACGKTFSHDVVAFPKGVIGRCPNEECTIYHVDDGCSF